jgi:hypothetical protein
MLFLVIQEPKTRNRAHLCVVMRFVIADTKAGAVRRAETMDVFSVARARDWKALRAVKAEDGEAVYV